MPGIKRPHVDENIDDSSCLHPSRKRRLEHGEANSQVAAILRDLADDISAVRLEAANKLLITLSTQAAGQAQVFDYTLTRLIKGLCSDRNAARLGFSIALAEVLRLAFDPKHKDKTRFSTLGTLIDEIITLTRPDGRASGQERRGYLLGRRSAYQAIIQSDILGNGSESEIKSVFNGLADLATEKQWLRSECLAVLDGYFNSPHGNRLGNQNARYLIDSWESKGLLKTPEGVALWISVRKAFPQIKLPKGLWHHNNPLSSQDRPQLSKIMLKSDVDSGDAETNPQSKKSGSRQSAPGLAWRVILSHLYNESKSSDFASFWSECVAKPMFSPSSSTERKALGLQLFNQALTTAPEHLLPFVVHPNIIRCILDHRAKADRWLFEASKSSLNQMVARGKGQPDAASQIVQQMMKIVPGNVDLLTKKSLETLLSHVDSHGLSDVVSAAVDLCWRTGTEDASHAEQKRRLLADLLLTNVRSRRGEPSDLYAEGSAETVFLAPWLKATLKELVKLGYANSEESTLPPMSNSSRSVFRNRLASCLSDLLDRPLDQAVLAPSSVIAALQSSREHLVADLNEEASRVIKTARKLEKAAAEKARGENNAQTTTNRAFQLLFALSILEVYNQEAESLNILEDIVTYYQSSREEEQPSLMLVELLLSFVSKQSGLFRKLAEQVFSAFASEVTSEGLQSMIEVLQQKEGLSGQQELFNQHDSDGSADDADEDGVDVEDDSDVELVNGEVVTANDKSDEEDDSESDDSNSEEDADDSGEEDEETAFDRKLADALGTAGMNVDSDDDGSDMDDDQMMALDPHLTTIFKERKTGSSKKQENKDAKDNMIHFKGRVLDLLKKYVESQYANPIALDLILPLTMLVRTTSSKAIAEKSFNSVLKPYFDACTKHKSLPQLENLKDCFGVLEAVHAEMKLGGSKFHANVCSRASLFLTRVLIGMDATCFDRIYDSYAALQKEWYRDPKSKIHGSIFTDWMNWVGSTRKHA